MVDGTGTTNYAYNNLGALTGTSHGATTFAYAYDPAGNLTSVAGPNGTTTTGYDADNLPVTMKRGTSGPTTYDYDPAGLLKKVTLPNNAVTDYTRDPAGQVTSQKHTLPTGTLATRDYTYDTAGNPTSLSTTRGTTTTNRTWAYDPANRLTAECTTTTACVPAAANLGWTYDKAGNILTDRDAAKTTAYTYDTAGQTLTQTAGTTTVPYTYDGDGNLTADGKRTYAYDLANRTTIVTTGAKTTAYTYDGNGNRASATTGTAVTNYTWDTNNALPMLVQESTGTTSQGYTYNPDGTPNALHATNTDWYYLADPQGSVTDVTTNTGARAASYDYTPYGQQRGPPLPDATTVPANQPLRYTGQHLDPTSGLYNLPARQYDPTTARFTSTDPIGGTGDTQTGNSLYAYANNSPLRYTDPSGLCWGPEITCDIGYGVAMGFVALGNGATGGTIAKFNEWVSPGSSCINQEADAYAPAARVAGEVAAMVIPIPGPQAIALAARGSTAAVRTARAARTIEEITSVAPNRIYSARVLRRMGEDTGPMHNFPGTFDGHIFQQGSRTANPGYFNKAKTGLSNDSVQYRLRGTIGRRYSGESRPPTYRTGTYEIFTRPSVSGRNEVITHRFFQPDKS